VDSPDLEASQITSFPSPCARRLFLPPRQRLTAASTFRATPASRTGRPWALRRALTRVLRSAWHRADLPSHDERVIGLPNPPRADPATVDRETGAPPSAPRTPGRCLSSRHDPPIRRDASGQDDDQRGDLSREGDRSFVHGRRSASL